MCPGPSDVSTQTFIFVDVDGVLNVGIRDQEAAPLLFSQSNKDYAESQRGRRQARAADEACVQRLLAVTDQPLPGQKGSYGQLACSPGSHITEAFARHLALVILAAGKKCTVVLSSNWRKPHHASRVRKLEAEISRHLGRSWAFDARTRPAEDRTAADRLRCIGDFVEALSTSGRFRDGRSLRLLVLEDFFISPLSGWTCGSSHIDSASAAEGYLKRRARAANVSAKLVHTYAEFTTPEGLHVEVGAGLTEQLAKQALAFLTATGPCPHAEPLLKEGHSGEPTDWSFEGDAALAKLAAVASGQRLDKVVAAAGVEKGELRLAELMASALPRLTMYLPCSV